MELGRDGGNVRGKRCQIVCNGQQCAVMWEAFHGTIRLWSFNEGKLVI